MSESSVHFFNLLFFSRFCGPVLPLLEWLAQLEHSNTLFDPVVDMVIEKLREQFNRSVSDDITDIPAATQGRSDR